MLARKPLREPSVPRNSLLLYMALVASAAFAQTPPPPLAKPPAGARHYIIQSTAGPHGESWLWTTPDGTRWGRESINLRGQVFELDSAGKQGPDGMPSSVTIRGITPQGDAGEAFAVANGKATWKSPVDAGTAAYASPAFYSSQGGPIDQTAWFLERILAAKDRTLTMLPGGVARAEKLVTVTVGSGANAKDVTAWSITGVQNYPVPMWADANGKFFGFVFFLSWLPEEYQGEHAKLNDAQAQALAAQAPVLAKRFAKMPDTAVAFRNVQVYDAEARRFLADQTVVVDKGVIAAAGAAATVKLPAGAQVIDGRGKTLLPGIWDCHLHVANDYTGLQALSMGVTSLRDPGNDDSLTVDRRERAARGELLMPNVYASSLIDGKGKFAAQVANVATSEAETVELVRKAKEKGMVGVKFYGTLDKAWLPAGIAEAHKLGLHVHGHIPVGMRPLAALEAGYDEITHINWVIMQAMPEDIVKVSNSIARMEGPARYGKDLDLGSKPVADIVGAMARKGTYVDPTMVIFETLLTPEPGEIAPAYSAFVGTLPPTVERGFRSGGLAVPKDLTRAHYKASWEKLKQLLFKLQEAGVTIVAGTDGSGLELIRELEIYVEAGFSPAEALATATINPAKLVGQDQKTGSIKVGKAADLVLVEGDPSRQISDLRNTRVVMLGGKLMDADELRKAAGFSGRPK
jgi:imidazolonepropionase-like amidohydrolase